jgi:hypothetical protein
VDQEQAMTELDAAVEALSRQAEWERLDRVAKALYVANRLHKVPQRTLVERTGYTRETIRRHVEDERIRRGEIKPTKRYLEAQRRRQPRAGTNS